MIARINSDCPLVDPEIIDGCLGAFLKRKCDYLSNTSITCRSLPRGIDDIDVFSFKALETAKKNANENYEKEHVAPYIYENKNQEFVLVKGLGLKNNYARSYRLTVDYPEDFEVVEKIYNALYDSRKLMLTEDVILFLDAHPEIVSINANCRQKSLK